MQKVVQRIIQFGKHPEFETQFVWRLANDRLIGKNYHQYQSVLHQKPYPRFGQEFLPVNCAVLQRFLEYQVWEVLDDQFSHWESEVKRLGKQRHLGSCNWVAGFSGSWAALHS